MKFVILGAAGRTGVHLVGQGLEAGHKVTAFVRDKKGTLTGHPNLTIRVGDARKTEDLASAIEGQEAVISALGSNKLGDDLTVQSTKALVEAMHKTGVKRIIMMSSFLASPNFKQTGFARMISKMLKSAVKDKQSGEEILKNSDLDWTIVYATRLDGAPPGNYRLVGAGETVSVRDAIARSDAAEFLLEQLNNQDSIKKSLVITAAKKV